MIITDHDHEMEYNGRYRTGKCAACGERILKHLSWGRFIAGRIGGVPHDYVDDDDG